MSATVGLDEGPRMLGPTLGVEHPAASIGMRVQPRIEAVSEDRAALVVEREA